MSGIEFSINPVDVVFQLMDHQIREKQLEVAESQLEIAKQQLHLAYQRDGRDAAKLRLYQQRNAMEWTRYLQQQIDYVYELFTCENVARVAFTLRSMPVDMAYSYLMHWLLIGEKLPSDWNVIRLANLSNITQVEKSAIVEGYIADKLSEALERVEIILLKRIVDDETAKKAFAERCNFLQSLFVDAKTGYLLQPDIDYGWFGDNPDSPPGATFRNSRSRLRSEHKIHWRDSRQGLSFLPQLTTNMPIDEVYAAFCEFLQLKLNAPSGHFKAVKCIDAQIGDYIAFFACYITYARQSNQYNPAVEPISACKQKINVPSEWISYGTKTSMTSGWRTPKEYSVLYKIGSGNTLALGNFNDIKTTSLVALCQKLFPELALSAKQLFAKADKHGVIHF